MLNFSVYEEDPDLNNEMEVSVSTCGASYNIKLGQQARLKYNKHLFILHTLQFISYSL